MLISMDNSRLSPKNVKVARPTLFNYIYTREEFEKYTNELFNFVLKEKMDVRIHEVYPLQDVARAHNVSFHQLLRAWRVLLLMVRQDIEGRKTTGKLLLKV